METDKKSFTKRLWESVKQSARKSEQKARREACAQRAKGHHTQEALLKMCDVLVAVTLFREDGLKLAGPAMVKTSPTHTVQRLTTCVCRWAGLPIDSCTFVFNGQPLQGERTVTASGLISSSAINVAVAQSAPAPDPKASGATFAMLDVEDSELAAAANSLGVT